MKRIFLVLAVLLAVSVNALAGDTYNKNVTLIAEGTNFKLLRVDAFTMTDSTGNFYSEPINLGGWNTVDGYVQFSHANITGTEDVDITYQYSYTKSNFGTWTAGTADANVTQLTGGTTANDTLGIAGGVDQILFHNSLWMRIKYDGQAGNPQVTITTYIWLNKS